MIERLAWVTCPAARGRDDDEPLALPALARAGVTADVVSWNDPAIPWADYDRVVLRSCWDYPERLPEFLDWLRSAEKVTDLRNPLDVVQWSLDKHYLARLDAAGVPIPPTVFLEPGDAFDIPAGDFVVKPAVGAGSRDAASYAPGHADQARTHIARLHARGASVLIQPLLRSVAAEGEWPLVFFGGEFSHAANKRVSLPQADVLDDFFAPETSTPHTPDDDQLAVARAALDVVSQSAGAPTYARIDLVKDDAGRSCVLEVELVEPSLFLPYTGPEAVDRLVSALLG